MDKKNADAALIPVQEVGLADLHGLAFALNGKALVILFKVVDAALKEKP